MRDDWLIKYERMKGGGIMQSTKFSLNTEDVKRIGLNALVFAAPALLVLIASFKNVVPADTQTGVIALFALNIATDLVRKFLKGN